VIYRLRHVTTYAYAHTVDLAAHLLLLTPRRLASQQVARTMVTVTPTPTRVTQATDHFGNQASRVFIDVPHARFEVVAEALVEVRFPDPPPASTSLPWEVVRDIARCSPAAEFIFPSPLAPLVPAARGYAAASFPARRPVLVGLLELMARIRRDFTYKPGVTGPNTVFPSIFFTYAALEFDSPIGVITSAPISATGSPCRDSGTDDITSPQYIDAYLCVEL